VEVEMVLKVIMDRRHVNRQHPTISINPKLKRIAINKTARELMIENYGRKFEHVLLLMDTENSDAFWIRPCEAAEDGARQLIVTSGNTITISCSLLLKEFNWKYTETQSFPLQWDDSNAGAKVDLNLDEEKR
jgi:hypothetical protein